jgi:hypothetical protein
MHGQRNIKKSRRISTSFMKIGPVSFILHWRAQMNFSPYFYIYAPISVNCGVRHQHNMQASIIKFSKKRSIKRRTFLLDVNDIIFKERLLHDVYSTSKIIYYIQSCLFWDKNCNFLTKILSSFYCKQSTIYGCNCPLTLILLTWKIWWASNNASRWRMGFNTVFKKLNC